jgi:hypothetical protein
MAGGARLPRLGLGTCLVQGDEAYAARPPAGPTSYDVRALGAVAEWLRSGLQSRVHRFDSGRRL